MKRSKVYPIKSMLGRGVPILSVLLVSGFLLSCPRSANAQFTWSGTQSNSWNVGANWSPSGGPPNSDTATATISSVMNNPVMINSSVTVASLTLSGSGNGVTITNNQTLFMDTVSGSASIGNNGVYSVMSGSGGILLSAGANNAALELDANTSLSGSGTVTLSTTGAGASFILQGVGGTTLTNSSTIQGAGIIGDGGLSLNNQAGGTINANFNGQTLTLNGSGGVTNTGLIEATNSGTLSIGSITVNNSGGNITASGGTVQLAGATIDGGTLNNNGGTLGTAASSAAFLNGSTAAGAVTINGTYTGANNSTTEVLGKITNQGNIQLNAVANSAILGLEGNTTLQGGGTVTLSTTGAGSSFILQEVGGSTLTNSNNTIQGAGIIGDGGLSLLNQAGGTILANVSGQTLALNGSGTTTNNGTFQANSGATLTVSNLSNLAASILTGGTYNVFSGTMQLPGNITTNAATILLDGSKAALNNSLGSNALAAFATNAAAGNFTIQNGANLTTSVAAFSNAGTFTVGASSNFFVGAAGLGTFTNSGLLEGTGTIHGNLVNALGGTVMPGLPGASGTLTVTGTYADPLGSDLNINIDSHGASVLAVGGTALLTGTTLDVSLLGNPTITTGEQFIILTSSGLGGTEFTNGTGPIVDGNVSFAIEYNPSADPNDVVLVATLSGGGGGGGGAVPEPASLIMFALGIAGMGAYVARRRAKVARA
jgi:hypothetical protein